MRVGADAVYIDDCGKPHGTFSFVSEDNLQATLQQLGFIGLSSKGYELDYHIEDNGGSQTLVARLPRATQEATSAPCSRSKLFGGRQLRVQAFRPAGP